MTDEQRSKLMMYHRVEELLGSNAADFTGDLFPALITEMGQVIDAIHTAASAQEVGVAVPSARRQQARAALIKKCNKFENTGKAIGRFLGDDVVVASFNLEPAYSVMADEQLIVAADTLKAAATPLAAEFRSRGFLPVFLADLQNARDAFHDSLAAGNTVAATETLVQKIARGDTIVSQFDVIVANVYDEDDPVSAPKRAAYDSARTVIRTRSQPLEVSLTATRSGNTVNGSVTLSKQAQAGDTVALRWREQGTAGPFTDGPVTSMSAGTINASPTVTVTTPNPVEVAARVIRADGSQFDSATVVVSE